MINRKSIIPVLTVLAGFMALFFVGVMDAGAICVPATSTTCSLSFPECFITKQTSINRIVTAVPDDAGKFPQESGTEVIYKYKIEGVASITNADLKYIEILIPKTVNIGSIHTNVTDISGTILYADAHSTGAKDSTFNFLRWTSLPLNCTYPAFFISLKFTNYNPVTEPTTMSLSVTLSGSTYASGTILGPMAPPPPVTGQTSFQTNSHVSPEGQLTYRTDVAVNDVLSFVCSGLPPFTPDPAGDPRCTAAVDGKTNPLFSCIPTNALPEGYQACNVGNGDSSLCFMRNIYSPSEVLLFTLKCDVLQNTSGTCTENTGFATCTTTKQGPVKKANGSYGYIYTTSCTTP